jgi:translation initiation factor 2D
VLEIDDAFYKAFLYGLNQSKDTGSPPRYGIEFPLRPSFIMSNLIQPFLPIFSSADAEALQIKKTSWKTMKKFLKTLDKKKPPFCWTKDQGGETNIFMIDFEHVEVDNFQRYSLPKKSKDTPQGSKSSGMATSDADPSVGQKLKIQVLYKAKEKHAALFSGADEARAYHSATHVKDAVAQYLERERLASATNKRLITLNPFLANSVIDGTKPTDRDAIARGTVPRDVLTERILSSCSPYHIILRNTSGSDSSAKPKAGNAPRVTIVLETRSGNKTVTKVSGLEAYFIPPQPLADELRKACAGSTSVDQLVGSSAKTPVMEVMVQGPQSQIILAALEKRGVDKRWIDLVDKTKKKK